MKKLLLALFISLIPFYTFSSIRIMTTRVIINEMDKEKTFTVRNISEKKPTLIQEWISEYAETGMEVKDNVPFLITPPIAKINKGKSKVLRIIPVEEMKEQLPKDRESVFWINVLDVPPSEGKPNNNEINLAFRTRVKLFYRPASLQGTTIDAAEKMKVDIIKTSSGYTVKLTNEQPYYISISGFKIFHDKKILASQQGNMLSPYSEEILHFDGIHQSGVTLKLEYITELGAFVEKQYK